MRQFIFLIGIGLLIGCKEKVSDTGSISGTISDKVTSEVIQSATLSIDRLGLSTTSDASGSFDFSAVETGTYNLIASKDGYSESKKAVTVMAGQETSIEFELSRQLPVYSHDTVYLRNSKIRETVDVENTGGASLLLNLTTSANWVEVDNSVINLDPFSEKTFAISVDTTGLDYGIYYEDVQISFEGIIQSIKVKLDFLEDVEIVWKNWYLSVPIDNGSGKATSIFYQDILDDNLTTEERQYFWYDQSTASYVLWTKFTGYTTSGEYPLNGDAYCRTELREFWQGNQTTEDNWLMDDGYHKMESTIKVDFCEGIGETFVAQIHGKYSTDPAIDNTPATIKVKWANGTLRMNHYVKPPDNIWTSDYSDSFNMGKVDFEKFTVTLLVDNGVFYYALSCPAKGIDIALTEVYDFKSNGYHYDNYFKTGNYFKHNSDYTQSAQVRLFKVKTTHYE